jgi:hypothetical protein
MQSKDALEKELMSLEREFWSALKSRDASKATSLSDEPSVVIGPQGVGEIDRQTLSGMIEQAPYELRSFELEDFHVRPITDDVAVVAYKVLEEMVVDGEPITLEAFDSSVWVRRNGKWTCSLHTETIAGDAFGRD